MMRGARGLKNCVVVALGCVFFCPLIAGIAAAQEAMDRIVAVVEEAPIFRSEVDEALDEDLYVKRMRGDPLPADSAELEALRSELLDGIIERRIVIAKARKEGLEVSRTEVEDAMDNWLADLIKAAGSEAAFNTELQRQGMTLKDFKTEYRKDIEEQLLVSRFMTQTFKDVSVPETQVVAFYDNKRDSVPEIPEVVGLSHIIIIPRVAPEKEDQAISKVEGIVDRLDSGEAFGDVAKRSSDDAFTREQGGLIGTVTLKDLQPDLAEIAAGLEPGQVSDPTRTMYGIEIVRVDAKQGDNYTLRHILVKLSPDRSDTARAAMLAYEIRDRIGAGESFESLAKEYSNDPDSRENGGYVGEIEIEALDEAYRTALAGLAVGEVSDVISTGRGFQILKLVSRTPGREPSFDEAKAWIRSLITSRMREALFNQWLEKARKEIYVKRMDS
jgi:peptidyl-prolyl cis-trans isomerase SurA